VLIGNGSNLDRLSLIDEEKKGLTFDSDNIARANKDVNLSFIDCFLID